MKTLEIAIHALITTRLDYCNSLYLGISKSSISRLQLVQNAAAKFLKGQCKFDHVTSILKSLHWLPVHLRIEFKMILYVFKSINNLAPSYLSDQLYPYNPTRNLFYLFFCTDFQSGLRRLDSMYACMCCACLDVVFLVYPLIISLSVQCNTIGTKLFSKAICNLDKMSSALLDQITGISQPPFSFTPLIWISCL